jgi:hypothetical protein
VLAYSGRTSTGFGSSYYNGDYNNDFLPDGRQMDRGSAPATGGNLNTVGNLAIGLGDVGATLAQVSDSCAGTP